MSLTHVCRLCDAELTRTFVDLACLRYVRATSPEAIGCTAGDEDKRSGAQRLEHAKGWMSEMARALARNFKPRALWSLRLLVVCALLVPVFALAQKALAATAADNFNRANGSLGPNWTDISDGGLAIVSQAAAGTASAGVSGDIRTAESYTSDQYSQVAVTSTQLTGSQWIGPMVRAQNGGQNAYVGIYYWNNGSPDLMLFKRISGSWTQLGGTYSSGALAAGTQLQVKAAGSTISFLQNGVQRITATDTSLSGGAPGIMSYGTGQVDNWSGGDAAAHLLGRRDRFRADRHRGAAGQRRGQPQRQRQRPLHLRHRAGRRRRLQRDGEDLPVRPDLHRLQRLRHHSLRQHHQRGRLLHERCYLHGRRDRVRG